MPSVPARDVARLLVDIGVLLLRSGAHSERTVRNLKRFAASFGYQPDIFVAFSGITLTVHDHSRGQSTTLFGRVDSHGVRLSVVAAISQLSWHVLEAPMTVDDIHSELERIAALPHFPRWVTLLMIGLGCGALSRLAGAEWLITLFTAIASGVALWVRMKMTEWKFNTFLVIGSSATVATLIGGLAKVLQLGPTSGLAIAASVLFLIPGVPLINAVVDLINGHISVGIGRSVMGMGVAFFIAVGMLFGMQVTGVSL